MNDVGCWVSWDCVQSRISNTRKIGHSSLRAIYTAITWWPGLDCEIGQKFSSSVSINLPNKYLHCYFITVKWGRRGEDSSAYPVVHIIVGRMDVCFLSVRKSEMSDRMVGKPVMNEEKFGWEGKDRQWNNRKCALRWDGRRCSASFARSKCYHWVISVLQFWSNSVGKCVGVDAERERQGKCEKREGEKMKWKERKLNFEEKYTYKVWIKIL